VEKEKKTQKKKEEEPVEEEEEEVEEVEEEEDKIGEDFAKDPRAFALWVDAGKIADDALAHILTLIKPNAVIYDICVNSDNFIRAGLGKIYTKKKYTKGIAFPTSLSVNEICGHYSPTAEDVDENHKTLVTGDVVKIDLGVQLHGFAAVLAHTVVVGEETVTGRKADAILAAYQAVQASLRLFNIKKNDTDDITSTIKTVSDAYSVNPLEGVLSHKMKKDIIDTLDVIINKKTTEQKADIKDFEHGDVYGLDVLVSTGEGKPKESTLKTTIFKRALETTYKLKSDYSRKLLSVVEHNFFNFPFSMNAFDNEDNLKTTKNIDNLKTVSKVGLNECVSHDLFIPHPVLTEKKGDIVAQFKYTIAVRNEGPFIICGGLIDTSKFTTENSLKDEKLLAVLSKPLDAYLPNSKKSVKIVKVKDNKAKKAKKKEAKEKKAAQEK